MTTTVMPAKYLNILALSAIVFLACSFSATPIAALSTDSNALHARHAHIGPALARRAPKRCKHRSSSDGANSPTTTLSTTPKLHTPTTTPKLNTPKTTPKQNTPTNIPKPPPPPAPPNKRKAGLAYAGGPDLAKIILPRFNLGHVSAIYTWGVGKTPPAEKYYEEIPMLWGEKTEHEWKVVGRGYAKKALGFNEPNHNDQASMSPSRAAELWKKNMMHLKKEGYTLISPATTSGPDGIPWMQEFLRICGNDCVDKIAVHWYGISSQEFINYLKLWHDTFKKPIWVTEFACMDFVSYNRCPDINNFARSVRRFMDSQPWVEKYFPFVVAPSMGNVDPVNLLVGQDNYPTKLAHIYFD